MRLLLLVVAAISAAATWASAQNANNPMFTREQQGSDMFQGTYVLPGASIQVYPTPGATPNGNERSITYCSQTADSYVCFPTPNGTATPSPCTTPNGIYVKGGTCLNINESVKSRYVVVLPVPAATSTASVLIER